MTIAQVLGAPLLFMLMLFLLQIADFSRQAVANDHPASYPLEGIYSCSGLVPSDPCINIMYTPSNQATDLFMANFATMNAQRTGQEPFAVEKDILNDVTQIPFVKMGILPVTDEQFIYDYTLRHPNVTNWGVSFNFDTVPVPNVEYQVWFNATRVANGTDVFGSQIASFLRGMDEAISLNDPGAKVRAKFDVTVKDWPLVAPKVLSDTIVQNLGPVFFFCSVMVIFVNVLNQIVTEKEQKLRTGMEIMGLKPSVYWMSQYLSTTLVVFGASLVTTILGIAFRFSAFVNTNFMVLFLTFFLLGEAMTCFAFFITTFVSRSRVAVLTGIFVFITGLLLESFVFSTGFIGYVWFRPGATTVIYYFMTLFPFFNFGKLFLDISTLSTGRKDEITGTYLPGPGFPWSSLYQSMPLNLLPTYPDGLQPNVPPPVNSWYFLLMDILIYGVLTWYLDHVVPDEFGACDPPLFFLSASYWGMVDSKPLDPSKWLSDVLKTYGDIKGKQKQEPMDSDILEEKEEACSNEFNPSVRIVHLMKAYKQHWGKVSKVAVKETYLTIGSGELLALLGQNGAGKSTLINILCGLAPATAGDALIFGLSIKTQMQKIRSIMGVCAQHDLLFSELTAQEHIQLYAGLKGVPRSYWQRLVNDRLEAVKLFKVKDNLVSTFSGGMKRRLSLVIATIGDPKIVFLDEPTTGMDPVNRRHVWTFIERFKRNRVVVLTTHSMEEADVLGDRIAIMAHGRLRAIGNSVSLKTKFGAGYRLSIVTDPARSDLAKAIVSQQVPPAILEDDSAGSLLYQLSSSHTDLIPPFVRYLDSNPDDLIRAWGISQTTLEEVFLRLIREANPNGYSADELEESSTLIGKSSSSTLFNVSQLQSRLRFRRE